MTGSMAFFWRDIQTIRGACRAAIALPHVDIGELRAVQAGGAYPVTPDEQGAPMPSGIADLHEAHGRVTVQMARSAHTKRWQDSPPSIADLFAIPIIAKVAV